MALLPEGQGFLAWEAPWGERNLRMVGKKQDKVCDKDMDFK